MIVTQEVIGILATWRDAGILGAERASIEAQKGFGPDWSDWDAMSLDYTVQSMNCGGDELMDLCHADIPSEEERAAMHLIMNAVLAGDKPPGCHPAAKWICINPKLERGAE